MKIYAYIVTDKFGNQKLLSIPGHDGNEELPLASNNLEVMSAFNIVARETAVKQEKVVELISFQQVKVLQRFEK